MTGGTEPVALSKQASQTRTGLGLAAVLAVLLEHCLQKICPHRRQWCYMDSAAVPRASAAGRARCERYHVGAYLAAQERKVLAALCALRDLAIARPLLRADADALRLQLPQDGQPPQALVLDLPLKVAHELIGIGSRGSGGPGRARSEKGPK